MVINSGNFSANGNFSGYNTKGERIFIHKRQMDALGITKNEEFKQFFAIVENKTYGARLDASGNPIAYADGKTTMTRATATAVFKTKEDYINAHVLDRVLDAEVAQAVKREMNAVGITSHAELEALIS
jgi:hypothetical protein